MKIINMISVIENFIRERTLSVRLNLKYMRIPLRCLVSAADSNKSKTKGKVSGDLIGEPDPVSNLRPIRFHVPENESSIEKQFRLKREEVQKWNEEFWTSHNNRFKKERKDFIITNNLQNKNDPDDPLSPDQMSVFYKSFLDKTWRSHLVYNYEWYKKNADLVILAVRVNLYRLYRKLNLVKKNTA